MTMSSQQVATAGNCQRLNPWQSQFWGPNQTTAGNITKVNYVQRSTCGGKVVPLFVGLEQQNVSTGFLSLLSPGNLTATTPTIMLQLADPSRQDGNKMNGHLSLSHVWEVPRANSTSLVVGRFEGSFQWPCSEETVTVEGTITAWLWSSSSPPATGAEAGEASQNVTVFRGHLYLKETTTSPAVEPAARKGHVLASATVTSAAANNADYVALDGGQFALLGSVNTAFVTPSGMLYAHATVSNSQHSFAELQTWVLNMQTSSTQLSLNMTLPSFNGSVSLQAGPSPSSMEHVLRSVDLTGDRDAGPLQLGQSICRKGVYGHASPGFGGSLGAYVEGVFCFSTYVTGSDGTRYSNDSISTANVGTAPGVLDIVALLALNQTRDHNTMNAGYEPCAALTVSTTDNCAQLERSQLSYQFWAPWQAVPGNITIVHYPAQFDEGCGGTVPALIGIEQQNVSPDYLNQLKQEGLGMTFRLQLLDGGRWGRHGQLVSANLSLSDVWTVQRSNGTALLIGGMAGSFHWSCSGEHAVVKGSITAWLVPPELALHNVTTFRAHLQLTKKVPVTDLTLAIGAGYMSKPSNEAGEGFDVATLGFQQRDGRQAITAGPVITAFVSPTGMLYARATVSNGSNSSAEIAQLAANSVVPRLALNLTLPKLNVSIELEAGPWRIYWQDLMQYVYPAGDDEEAALLQPGQSFCRTGVTGHAKFLDKVLSVGLEGVLCIVVYPPADTLNSQPAMPSDTQQTPTRRVDVLTLVSISHQTYEEHSAGDNICAAPAAAEGTAQFQGSMDGQSFTGTFKSSSTEFLTADIAREQARFKLVTRDGPCNDPSRLQRARWASSIQQLLSAIYQHQWVI
jgi:hypothetical protein